MQLHPLVICSAILIASPVILVGVLAVDADETTTNGKVGQITLASRTSVGDITLEPGIYRVQHRMQGEIHLMHFKPVTNLREEWSALVECDRDPSRPPWKRTHVTLKKEGNTPRIQQIVLKGERVVYRFE